MNNYELKGEIIRFTFLYKELLRAKEPTSCKGHCTLHLHTYSILIGFSFKSSFL